MCTWLNNILADNLIGANQPEDKKATKGEVVNLMSLPSDYEMDDYELLLARHHLIQQQLQKVEGLNTFLEFYSLI